MSSNDKRLQNRLQQILDNIRCRGIDGLDLNEKQDLNYFIIHNHMREEQVNEVERQYKTELKGNEVLKKLVNTGLNGLSDKEINVIKEYYDDSYGWQTKASYLSNLLISQTRIRLK